MASDKPIRIPKIELVSGFQIRCSHVRCGAIDFAKKRRKAEELADQHTEYHRAHEEAVRKHLNALEEAQEISAVNGVILVARMTCPTCHANIGQAHDENCDVARCMVDGSQRKYKSHIPALETGEGDIDNPEHHCGIDVWTGFYPGEREAGKYGVSVDVLRRYGVWSSDAMEWTLPEGWEALAGLPKIGE